MGSKQTFAFGSGSVICLAGGVATKVGTLQEISIDLSSTNVMLTGQNQFPDAIARGEGKIQGKAKTGLLDLQLFSSTYLGLAIDTTGYTKLIEGEAKTIPASSTYTVTAANPNLTDLGVYYADGSGQLTPGTVATGKYTVNPTTGVYTFAPGDAGKAILLSYSYVSTNGSRVVVSNQAMGINPVFALQLQNGYANVNGTTYTSLKLFSCVTSKISFPFKNKDFVVSDMDFDCFADPTGKLYEFGIGT
jgi:hypothetical protein